MAWLTIDKVWIGYWIYWPLVYTTQNYTLQITYTHRLVSSVCYRLHQLFPGNSFCHGDSSASWTQVFLSQPPVQNSCQLTTQLTGPQTGGHFTPTSYPFLHKLTFNWQLKSLTHHLLHVTSLNWTADSFSGTRLTLLITFRQEPYRKHSFYCYSPTIPQPLHVCPLVLWEHVYRTIA
jgi:hypothetical protein